MKKIKYIITVIALFFIFTINANAVNNPIKDGVYTITTALNNGYAVDLTGGKVANSSNIELYKLHGGTAQQFKVTYLKNGYYKIASIKNTNYVLDVAGGKKTNGTNVWLYKSNNSAAQQWIIKDVGGGYYNIISRANNLALEIHGAKIKNGANIDVWQNKNAKNQKFRFNQVVTNGKTINNGTYIISSYIDNTKVIDLYKGTIANKQNIELYTFKNNAAQKWNVTYIKDGYYKITLAANNSYALNVYGGKKANGTNIQLYKYKDDPSVHWIIKDVGGGYYNIISKSNNLALEIHGAKAVNLANIDVWQNKNAKNQKFKFTPVTNLTEPKIEAKLTSSNSSEKSYSIGINTNYQTITGIELYKSSGNGYTLAYRGTSRTVTEKFKTNTKGYFYKLRAYKDTANGRIYSTYSDPITLDNGFDVTTKLTYKNIANSKYVYNIAVNSNIENYQAQKNTAILEIFKYNWSTQDFELYKTVNKNFNGDITLDSNYSLDSFRVRVSILKNNVRIYSKMSEEIYPNYYYSEKNFNITNTKTNNSDGTIKLNLSSPITDVNYMIIYETDKDGNYDRTKNMIYDGTKLSFSTNIPSNTTKYYLMKLYRYDTSNNLYYVGESNLLKVN